MNPKSRKEILDTCQSNFWGYTPLTKVLIITSLVLSAASIALYICEYIYPLVCGIASGEIIGWYLVWKICFAFILYVVLRTINLIFVSIGGSAVCKEENWDIDDFANAWLNVYKYEGDSDDENFEK
jgi:hypothetical protein